MKKKFPVKNPGIVILVPTIILSGLILVVSIGLSRVLIAELEFSADLLFSEKAYFAAESGVEKSLLVLKNNSLNWIEDQDSVSVGTGAEYQMSIDNSVERFDFSLASRETTQFQLAVDTQSDETAAIINATGVAVTPTDNNLQWKILCPATNSDGTSQTISLQGRADKLLQGRYDDGTTSTPETSVSSFFTNWLGNDICFMSLTNLGTDYIEGSVTSTQKIAPARVLVRAVGTSFSREKIVTFDYLQKNLASIFNFGLYFIEE